MKHSILKKLIAVAIIATTSLTVSAQTIDGKHGSDDFKIGVAGFTYRNFSLEETLKTLQSMGVKYLSVKDWWLPLNSTKEQMDKFKATCAKYGVEGYILGPIYMHSKEEVDKEFDSFLR